jgi:hypothetical protein
MKTVRQIIEAVIPTLSPVRQKWARKLTEDDAANAPAEGDALKDALKAAVNAIMDDDTLDGNEQAKRIGAFIKTHAKVTQEAEPEEPTMTEDDDGDEKDKVKESDDSDDDDKKKQEATDLALLKRKDAVTTLCEDMDFVPTKDQRKDLIECEDDKARAKLAKSYKALAEAKKVTETKTGARSRGHSTTSVSEQRVTNDDLRTKYSVIE